MAEGLPAAGRRAAADGRQTCGFGFISLEFLNRTIMLY
jgi:hypothetical protein